MVRDAARRTTKYDAKIVGDVIKNRIDAQKASMVEQVTNRFADIVAMETQVKNLLTGWGVSTILVPFYLSFGRKCYGLSLKHTGTTLHDEVCIAHDAWKARGLDSYYIQVIASDVFSVDISDCT